MSGVVTIDPAARRYAYAISHDGVTVAVADYGKTVEDVLQHLPAGGRYQWVFERPKRYNRFAVAHKDLDDLDATLAELRCAAKARGDDTPISYEPFAWKGNVPKYTHHERTWAVLSRDERLVLPDRPHRNGKYQHDVHDAVAIFLFHVGRTGRGGTDV